MIRSLMDLSGFKVVTPAGEAGRVDHFSFSGQDDGREWRVRYFSIDPRGGSRRSWLPVSALRSVDLREETCDLAVTSEQLKSNPEVTDRAPGRDELARLIHYWEHSAGIGQVTLGDAALAGTEQVEGAADLRSSDALQRLRVSSVDDATRTGRVVDALVDDQTWVMRYLVIEIPFVRKGHCAIVSPDWVKSVDWEAGALKLDHSWEEILAAPSCESFGKVDREYETKLHKHFHRTGYWSREEVEAVGAGAHVSWLDSIRTKTPRSANRRGGSAA